MAYLGSRAWRQVRERYKASDLPQVCRCGATRWQLHHTTYERVGRERLEDLIPLCSECHATAHALERAGVIDLDLFGFYYTFERALQNFKAEEARKAQAREDFMAPTKLSPRRARRAARGRRLRAESGNR